MSRLLVGRSLRHAYLLIVAVGLGCGIQREGQGSDPVDDDATGSGGQSVPDTGGVGVAGVFGLGGESNTGGMGGSLGEAGSSGSAGTVGGSVGTGGNGGASGAAGSAGAMFDAGSPDANDAANDIAVIDVVNDAATDVSRDASPDVAPADSGTRDAEASVDAAKADVCIPETEVCDGLDNNCNGSVDEQNACPNGCMGITFRAKGYMFCYGQSRWATWPDAQADCVSRGMHLIRVDDAAENQWMIDTATGVGYSGGVWIGANDRETDGHWVWIDGAQFWQGAASGTPIGGLYNDWGTGQPNNNADGGEACGVLEMNGTWFWNDLGCDDFTRAYVCEK